MHHERFFWLCWLDLLACWATLYCFSQLWVHSWPVHDFSGCVCCVLSSNVRSMGSRQHLTDVSITIRIPLNTSPLQAISSSLYSQYGRRTRGVFFLSSGQPVWIAFMRVCSAISAAILRLICSSLWSLTKMLSSLAMSVISDRGLLSHWSAGRSDSPACLNWLDLMEVTP